MTNSKREAVGGKPAESIMEAKGGEWTLGQLGIQDHTCLIPKPLSLCNRPWNTYHVPSVSQSKYEGRSPHMWSNPGSTNFWTSLEGGDNGNWDDWFLLFWFI